MVPQPEAHVPVDAAPDVERLRIGKIALVIRFVVDSKPARSSRPVLLSSSSWLASLLLLSECYDSLTSHSTDSPGRIQF